MLEISKKKDTGIKLEVNENVLTSCTTLMEAIYQLIIDSKKLQEEIIVRGRVCTVIILKGYKKLKLSHAGLSFGHRILST